MMPAAPCCPLLAVWRIAPCCVAQRCMAWRWGAEAKETVICGGPGTGCGGGGSFGTPGAGEGNTLLPPSPPHFTVTLALTSPPHSHVPTLRPTFPCYPMPPSHTLRHMIFASSPLRPTFHQHHVPLPHQPSFCFCLFLWGLILLGDFAGSMRPCGGKTLKCHGNVS